MANFGRGSIARTVITVDGLGDSHLSDAYDASAKTGVDISASFYIKGKKSAATIDVDKSAMTKQGDGDSDSYMALVDTSQLQAGTILAELTIKFFDGSGNAITEIIPDVATGITTKESA